MSLRFPVGICRRHVHLSTEHVGVLFGTGYQITKLRDLRQTGEYAANEALTVQGPRARIEGVRVVGPCRGQSQVELTRSDAMTLGLNPPVTYSGHLAGSAPITIIGPAGRVDLPEGAIIPQAHLHMSTQMAADLGLNDRDNVFVAPALPPEAMASPNRRIVIFGNVYARVGDSFVPEFHLDSDEANAAGLTNEDQVYVVQSSIPQLVITPQSRLITENDVRQAILNKRKIRVKPGMIVTPAAQELGRARGVLV